MPWYAASAIMYLKFKDGNQDSYPVWENALLIEAMDPEDAEQLACKRAKEDESGSNESLTWKDRPATWNFAGLRKLLIVSHPDDNEKELNGAEVTFSEFEVSNKESFQKLVNGDDVDIRYYSD